MATTPITPRRSTPRQFYFYAVLGAALIVFVGFAQSYFLKGFFGTPPLYPLLHLHGFIMTSWFVLFATQTWLIEAHRVRLHRRLGIFGALLAATILIVGAAVVTINAREGRVPPAAPVPVIMFLSYANLLAFGVLVGAAIYFRGRGEFHKRFMLVATLNLLPAAISRIPLDLIQSGGLLAVFGLPDLFILICVASSTTRRDIGDCILRSAGARSLASRGPPWELSWAAHLLEAPSPRGSSIKRIKHSPPFFAQNGRHEAQPPDRWCPALTCAAESSFLYIVYVQCTAVICFSGSSLNQPPRFTGK